MTRYPVMTTEEARDCWTTSVLSLDDAAIVRELRQVIVDARDLLLREKQWEQVSAALRALGDEA